MSVVRWAILAALIAALAWAGWNMVADYSRPDPDERLRQAHALLQQGRADEAADIARQVLAEAPSHGRAFGLLAPALANAEDPAATRALYEIAARRAPRDVGVRAWLAAHFLQALDFDAAMPHLDALLSATPESRAEALPLVAQLAADRTFAGALGAHLADNPRWRPQLLAAARRSETPGASDNLHAALRSHGALTPAETARWLDGLLADGRWGTAYAYWIGDLGETPASLPLLYNGDFARPISNHGFDWRLRRVNGVVAGRLEAPNGGHHLRLTFLGRNVGRTGLEQPLLLAPGSYRLEFQARTEGFRSHRGLEWQLTCSDGRTRIGAGGTITDHPRWETVEMEFEVPGEGCEGQWLRLVNPAPRGVAQAVRGEVRVANVGITRIQSEVRSVSRVGARVISSPTKSAFTPI